MKSCQIGAITTILLLNALALDLASVAVGTIVISSADVVGGVVLLSLDPVEGAMDDGVDGVVEEGELDGVKVDLESPDPEVTLKVDDCMPLTPIALEFVPLPEEMLELDGRLELCDAEDDDDEVLFGDVLTPVVMCILVLPVWTMLFWDEDPTILLDLVPKRAEVMSDEGETPVPLLGKFLMEPPIGPPVVSPERLDETVG